MTIDDPAYDADLTATADDPLNRATVRGRHDLALDEPRWSERGEDRAPCPVDYLLVGVAGCQLETVRHCLERSRVDDYRVDVSVHAEFDTPADGESGVPDPTSNRVTAIHLSFEVTTTAEDERRAERCLDIAEDQGCIVSRTVAAGVDVPLSTTVRVRSGDEKS